MSAFFRKMLQRLSWLCVGCLMLHGQARAQTSVLDGLPPAAIAKIVDVQSITAAFGNRRDRPVRLVVELARPVPVPGSFAARPDGAGDLARSLALREVQDRVLDRVLQARSEPEGGASEDAQRQRLAVDVARMTLVPAVALSADETLLRRLAEDPEVERIHQDILVASALDSSTAQIGATASSMMGTGGHGWNVVVLDTGARRSHEFLRGRFVAAACFSSTDSIYRAQSMCPGGAQEVRSIAAADDCDPAVLRGCGHGSHVAGIIAGSLLSSRSGAPTQGVAPRAGLISINVFSRLAPATCAALGYPADSGQQGCALAFGSDILRGLEEAYSLRTAHRIAAVNLSLASGIFPTESGCRAVMPPVAEVIELLRLAGIVTVAAAGNNGRDSAVSWPACLSNAVAVASSSADDTRYASSNWGEMIDLVAPGRQIRSSVVSGSADDVYGDMSGTSMAAAHVSGALATMRAYRPEVTVDQLLSALRNTGTPVSAAGITRPRIDLERAIARLSGDRNPTMIHLSGPSIAQEGGGLVLTARISTQDGSPRGNVSFHSNGYPLATGTIDAQGRTSVTIASFGVGRHHVTASYPGDQRFAPSASTPHLVEVVPRPAQPPAFVGGGSLFAFTAECTPVWGNGPEAVTVRYGLDSEATGLGSEVTLSWPSGSEHLSLHGPMNPSAVFLGGAGRQIWGRFVFYPRRPLIRVLQRQISHPAGATDLAQAEELVLRLRIQHFGAVPGCAVTMAATLRRDGAG